MTATTICFTDTETTGFDHRKQHIIQIAVLKVEVGKDPSDMRVLCEYERKLQLPQGAIVSPKAAAVNGYTPEVWAAEAQDRRVTMVEYLRLLEWSSFGGQNPQFDYRFIDEELHRQSLVWPKMRNYTLYAVEMLARPLHHVGLLANVKQETLCEFFNIGAQTHDALDDIRQAVQIYQKLLYLCIHGISDTRIQEAIELTLDLTPATKS